MPAKKVNLSVQEDIGTEESNDAEAEAPEITLEAPDASEVNHATISDRNISIIQESHFSSYQHKCGIQSLCKYNQGCILSLTFVKC